MIRTLLLYSALGFAASATPAVASDTDFPVCDGFKAPTNRVDGMTRETSLWGLAVGTADIRMGQLNLGKAGVESCDVALADARMTPAFWLRRAHLLQFKAIHAIAAGKAEEALPLLADSDALGKANASPTFAASMGLGNRAVRAYALAELKRDAEAQQEIQAMVVARPWAPKIRRLAIDLKSRLNSVRGIAVEDLTAERRMMPEFAHALFWIHFSAERYADAIANARLVDFDMPKSRGGWIVAGEHSNQLQGIVRRANFAGAWAYATAATGNEDQGSLLIAEARKELDEADTAPSPQNDGRPPRKSDVEAFNARLPFVREGRGALGQWEQAIALRKQAASMDAQAVMARYESADLQKLPVLADLMMRFRITNPEEAAARDAAIERYRANTQRAWKSAFAFGISDLARSLPKPETVEMVPVMKPAGDGYFLSDSGLSRKKEDDAAIWTIRYTHKLASPEAVQELAMMGAAQTAMAQNKAGFVILSARSVERTTHVTNTFYGVPMSKFDLNSGYETQLRVRLVDAVQSSTDAPDPSWRVIAAQDVLNVLDTRYKTSKGVTVAW